MSSIQQDVGAAVQEVVGGAQGSPCELAVHGNHQASVRRSRVPQDNVATALAIDHVPRLLEGLNGLSAGDPRQPGQVATSTISSSIGGGIGSFRSRRLSR